VFNLGVSEIVVILVVALVFLGPKKLPELASGLGKMIRELRKATSDIKNEIELDETIRKPVEELREAMTLHPEELKRRDRVKAERLREEREARERAEKEAAQAKVAEEATARSAAPPSDKTIVTSAANGDKNAPASDKTIAMASPFSTSDNPPATLPRPGGPARPTLLGMPPASTLPRPSVPPPPPAAAKLPPPPSGIRPVPAPPPAKKD
jgi:sec-independent protein translocase protein TatA